jgi:hypothetical protein
VQTRKTLFCIFLSFRNLPELKLTWDFWSINILSREAPREEELNELRSRGQMSTGGAGPCQAVPPSVVRASSLQHRQSLSLDAELDLTMPIYILRIQSQSDAAEKHERQKHRPFQRRLEGETLLKSPRSLLHPLWRQHHHHRHEEGVFHLWTMGLWQ